MDLKTFISETLEQLVDGIRQARTKEAGVNAEMYGLPPKDSKISLGGTSGQFTVVDFDVAISAETSASGKAGLTVFGIGAEGGGDHKRSYANRITFSVPVKLPDGAKAQRRVLP